MSRPPSSNPKAFPVTAHLSERDKLMIEVLARVTHRTVSASCALALSQYWHEQPREVQDEVQRQMCQAAPQLCPKCEKVNLAFDETEKLVSCPNSGCRAGSREWHQQIHASGFASSVLADVRDR